MLDRGELLKCLRAFKRGDFTMRMPVNLTGIDGEIAQAFNDVVELNLRKSESLLKSKQDELRAANEQLREKAEQLSLASRYKSEFLANMSHELRTPLNSLLILARLLSDNIGGNLTPKQVEFAKTIHSSGAELLALINDILDLAKIESGTVTLNIANEDFREVRESVERTFRQVASDRSLEFGIGVDGALPATIETDGKRLQQILANLLSNAFKFTARGSVRLWIVPAAGGWSPGHPVLDRADLVVAFSVADTGIGIPGSKQRLIFEAFQQADGTTSREYGGTGLGLSISRDLARLLGGEIRVDSTPGQGSTFTLYLPLGRCAPSEPVASVAPQREDRDAKPGGELAGRTVLVVDDDIRNVSALTDALEAHGLHVIRAGSGREGIALLERANGVDAVLMDVMMPGLDGRDTIRIVRQLEGRHHLPILAVTARAMLGDREKCLAAGANDYVAKPVDIDELLAKLEGLILLGRQPARPPEDPDMSGS
jgi:signal transduction histidine kinase/CheY-like chemotaxis protein